MTCSIRWVALFHVIHMKFFLKIDVIMAWLLRSLIFETILPEFIIDIFVFKKKVINTWIIVHLYTSACELYDDA